MSSLSKSLGLRSMSTVHWGLACLVHELAERRLHAERQKALPINYKGIRIDCGYRIDLLVEREVIVELKAVSRLEPIHEAQLLSYLKLSGCHVGLLVNFNVKQLTTGLRRLVNAFSEPSLRSPRALG